MLEFMSARRFYLTVALVSVAVTTALLTLSRTVETEPAPEPTPVIATVPSVEVTATESDASETETDADTRVAAINLALVIDEEGHWPAIPQDPDARLAELAAAANAGAPDAANELALLAYRCSEKGPIPMPHTEAAYAAARDRLIQTRTLSDFGPPVRDIDRALLLLEQGYRLCSAFARLELPGHAHWNRVAAELGSHLAAVFYWEAQRGEEHWETLQARSIEYLERARDDGFLPAFFVIGTMQGEFEPDGPYTPDHAEALAHLYASIDLQDAIIAGHEASGYFAEDPRRRQSAEMRRRMVAHQVSQLEMRVSPYQIQAARERADELLDRCCR